MAQVRAALGDFDAAADLLDQAEALYRHGFYPDIRPIPAMRARVHIAAGRPRRGRGVGTRTMTSRLPMRPTYLHEYDHLTLVRLLLAQHRASPDEESPEPATRHHSATRSRCSTGSTPRRRRRAAPAA